MSVVVVAIVLKVFALEPKLLRMLDKLLSPTRADFTLLRRCAYELNALDEELNSTTVLSIVLYFA
jgi:hypothetical protein